MKTVGLVRQLHEHSKETVDQPGELRPCKLRNGVTELLERLFVSSSGRRIGGWI
ncbi:hypothetical protein HPP92_005845 [Vanilla planifolia]|uniref:Uncharacterized protein n=1 Tax=Vanilla planifolia TaxID=51239 RepID=A0A835RUE6_VANPL|nr:hypothetical protein HPP92_005845 [Vanilla planifolia]